MPWGLWHAFTPLRTLPPPSPNVPSVHLSQDWLTPHAAVTRALISMPVIWGSQGLVGPHLASLMSCLWWSWLIRGPDHYANEKHRGAAFCVVQLCCLCHQHTLGIGDVIWMRVFVSERGKQCLCTAMGRVLWNMLFKKKVLLILWSQFRSGVYKLIFEGHCPAEFSF